MISVGVRPVSCPGISGTWVTLASGTGSAAYACVGTTTRTYRTGATVKDRSVTAACG